MEELKRKLFIILNLHKYQWVICIAETDVELREIDDLGQFLGLMSRGYRVYDEKRFPPSFILSYGPTSQIRYRFRPSYKAKNRNL